MSISFFERSGMRRSELEHIIRAAGAIAGINNLINRGFDG